MTVGGVKKALDPGKCRINHQSVIQQQGENAPSATFSIQKHCRIRRRQPGLQYRVQHLSGQLEIQIGRDAGLLGQTVLQPAPHARLRNKHGIGQQPIAVVACGQTRAQGVGQCRQVIAVMQEKAGCRGHASIMPNLGRKSRDCVGKPANGLYSMRKPRYNDALTPDRALTQTGALCAITIWYS